MWGWALTKGNNNRDNIVVAYIYTPGEDKIEGIIAKHNRIMISAREQPAPKSKHIEGYVIAAGHH